MVDASSVVTLEDDRVVVVGLGPVGAVAALALARTGRRVVVVEADDALRMDPSESRASTFHPPTLEMLDQLGVFEELYSTGLVAPTFQIRDRREGVVAQFDLRTLASDTRFPYRLQSEQQNLVAIIARKLANMPTAQIRLGHRVSLAKSYDDGCLLEFDDGIAPIYAHWVIAADGANSAVRRTLSIDFPGLTYPERYLVISTTYPMERILPDIASVNYVSADDGWFVLLKTPRHWRVLFPVFGDASVKSLTTNHALQAQMRAIAEINGDYPISHTTVYNVHQRVAANFRLGRVLLIGDAAHINNPLGGMGMNSGIHDALAAVEALSAAINGDEYALDRFANVRRKVAMDFVQRATHRNWEALQERDPEVRAARNEGLRSIAADPKRAHEYLLVSSMLKNTVSPDGDSVGVGVEGEDSM